MKKLSLFLFLSLLTLNCKKENQEQEEPIETPTKIDLNKGLFAKFSTDKGEILIHLEYQKGPITVANFVSLAEGKNEFVDPKFIGKHYYDGLTFHRVEANFMIQGGDPDGTGMGGPGYQFKDEFHPDLVHNKAGILSMANSGPNTNGSQFFITHNETPFLDGKHSVFGSVVKGQEIVNKIAKGDKINKIEILRKGDEAIKFDAVKIFADYFKVEKEKQEKITQVYKKQSEYLSSIQSSGTKTKSGLIYKILKSSNGKKPNPDEKVSLNYAGFLMNGTLFDTSIVETAKKFGKFDQNRQNNNGYQPLPFTIGDKVSLIAGFIEAIELMKKGDKLIAIMPPNLAYGDQGAGSDIPPNSTIAFEIELLK